MVSRALRLPWVGLPLLLAVTATGAVTVTATRAAGQERSCDLVSSGGLVSNQVNDARVNYVSSPRFECDDGTLISADSSVTFEATSFHQLFGSVVFRDNRRELHSDRAQYFDRVGRLQAQGSVRLENREDGSWVTGEDLVLLQEGDDRPEDDVTVREGRPHASLVPRARPDSTAAEELPRAAPSGDTARVVPYEVDADMIHMVGDVLFQARGRVEVTHESAQFYGDSLEFKQDIGSAMLFRNARILSQDTVSADTLDIRGDTIAIDLPNDEINEIEARGRANLLAEGVDMRGPLIRLKLEEEELEQVFAVRRDLEENPEGDPEEDPDPVSRVPGADESAFSVPEQPRAFAEDIDLAGDSIQAELTEGQLDRVVAIGSARGVSTARDSLNTDDMDELIRTDWIEGDTITATFGDVATDTAAPTADSLDTSDSAASSAETKPAERQLELLVARGNARSFYRSTPDSTVADASAGPVPLDLNYVIGDEIRLFMDGGEVDRMEVDNPTGIFLQPRRAPPLDPEAPTLDPGADAVDPDASTVDPGAPPVDSVAPPVDPGSPNGSGGQP